MGVLAVRCAVFPMTFTHPDPLELDSLRHLWSWIRVGARPEDSASLRRKLVQVNAGAALAILIILAYNLAFLVSGNTALIRSGLAQLAFAALLPMVWWLNHRRQILWARWCLFAVVMMDAVAAIVAGQGTVTHVHLYFIVFAVLTPTLFAIEQLRSQLVCVTANLLLYAAFEALGWPPHPALASLSPLWVEAITLSIMLSCGLTAVLMGFLTELASADNERHLQRLAATDVLTGLPNRRHFLQTLATEASRAGRSGQTLAVAMFDIDHFKQVNDRLGHEGGDRALERVARVAQATVRPYDVVARVGGEEFAILLPATHADEAVQVAERFRAMLAGERFEHQGQSQPLTASVGVAVLHPGMPPDLALRQADEALYRAKSAGRNRVTLTARESSQDVA